MAIPTPKVEFGFDLSNNPGAPFFRLDDAVQGRLDNTEYRLAGTLFLDVTDRVRDISVERGRTSLFTRFPAGTLSLSLNNHDRAFDPLYTASPYNGNIVPEREVRISSNGTVIFLGYIDDWNLSYLNDGDSTVEVVATDAISKFNNQYLPAFTPPQESVTDRLNRVLDLDSVAWPSGLRAIDSDSQLMSSTAVEQGKSALEYMQNIALSEPGQFFISRDGMATFTNRRTAPTSASLVTFGANDVPFDNVAVVYGAELLFNQISITREGGGTATAFDQASINQYGVRKLEVNDIQSATDEQMVEIAVAYASLYSEPEYRFEQFDVYLHKLDAATQNDLVALDIGSVVQVKFTPNNIGDEIVQYGEVIRVEHVINVEQHVMTLGLAQLVYQPLVLDDAVFGKLDVGTLSW